ncbi:MAG TPA: sensor domain-containing diguanylate cyclase [bacterium]|nr:sensor domain-containing diguanylate cyclase [bacterium]
MKRFLSLFFSAFLLATVLFINLRYLHQPVDLLSSRILVALVDIIAGAALLNLLLIQDYHRSQINRIEREQQKCQLQLSDHSRESGLLSTLNEIIAIFGETPDLDAILNRIAEASIRFVKADNLILQIYGSEDLSYFSRVVKGREVVELGEELLEETMLMGVSTLIANTASFPRYQFLARNGFFSLLVVPLRIRGNNVGLISVLGKETNAFTGSDLEFMSTLAGQVSLIIENATLFEKTRRLSMTDGLTNLFNRRYFEAFLDQEIRKTESGSTPLSIAMIDLDDFKKFNDHNGHLAGDEALRDIARTLRQGTKGRDIIARYGGEEFVVIFPQTLPANAGLVCENLRLAVERQTFPGEASQSGGNLTISIGLASYPDDGQTSRQVLEKADARLYEAKRLGRNRVVMAGRG